MGSFRATLSIYKESNNAPIFFKTDGERFAQPKTVKLLADCKYRLDIVFRPAKKMASVSLMERSLDVVEKLQEEEGVESSAYSAHFHTDNVTPSKKGQRETIPLLLKLQGGYQFSTQLQVKWYKPTSTQHCEWGTSVKFIEYECSIDQMTNNVKIMKDTFR